ncbi:MAG: SPFH domain-containing protein [Chloroflexi bacterium]|nr:SPFH domain-containing protein [Chloroflexota bacterium]
MARISRVFSPGLIAAGAALFLLAACLGPDSPLCDTDTAPRSITLGMQTVDGETTSIPREISQVAGDLNIIDLTARISYRVADQDAYLRHVESADDCPDARLLRSVALPSMSAQAGRLHSDDLLSRKEEAAFLSGMEATSQALLDDYGTGLEILGISLLSANLPFEVQPTEDDVVQAEADRRSKIAEGEAYRDAALERARVDATRIVEDAQAELEADKGAAVAHLMALSSDTPTREHLQELESLMPGFTAFLKEPMPNAPTTGSFASYVPTRAPTTPELRTAVRRQAVDDGTTPLLYTEIAADYPDAESQFMEVTAYAVFRIISPPDVEDIQDRVKRLMVASIRDVIGRGLREELMGSSLEVEYGPPFRVITSPIFAEDGLLSRDSITARVVAMANPQASEFGLEIVDVRFKYVTFFEGVRDAVLARMRSVREFRADWLRAEGEAELASLIHDADELAAALVANARTVALVDLLMDRALTEPRERGFSEPLSAYRSSFHVD